MKPISNSATAQKYDRLGFLLVEREYCLRLTLGNISISGVEHPWNGVRLTFESFTARTMHQHESCLPERCSVEQIAGLIYVNVVQNFRDRAPMFKAHFQLLGIPLFQ